MKAERGVGFMDEDGSGGGRGRKEKVGKANFERSTSNVQLPTKERGRLMVGGGLGGGGFGV